MPDDADPPVRPPRVPPTIIYGPNPPKVSFRLGADGWQYYFSSNNENLRLSYERDFDVGSFTVARHLGKLCGTHCRSKRSHAAPCPAFIESHKIGVEDRDLATVVMRDKPAWEECAGVRLLLDMCQTEDEANFLRMYLDWNYGMKDGYRSNLVSAWNRGWHRINGDWTFRQVVFDDMIWGTLRFPSLIPQAWINWVGDGSDKDRKVLDDNASRVDFIALSEGRRYVIEIDGLSHYADFDGRSYKFNDATAARTLRIDRTLKKQKWEPIRIARIEVREAFEAGTPWKIAHLLPFRAMDLPTMAQLGVGKLDPPLVPDEADIPF